MNVKEAILSEVLKSDFEMFTRYFYKRTTGDKLILNFHHRIIFNTLEKVYNGEIKRLIINIPPGYSKTMLAVVYFIAWCLAKDDRSRFMHLSYADDLALKNSSECKDIVTCERYRELFGVKIRKDVNSKKAWETLNNGRMYATSSGGQITGFRAGKMDKGLFTGSLIVDDPLKTDDSFSDTLRSFINKRYNTTFKSRLAHEDIPVVVIMQRLHVDDFSAYLLNGGSGEKWHHLNLPIQYQEPRAFSHSIPIEVKPYSVLWEYKHDLGEIEILKNADLYTYNSQYMQEPQSLENGIYKEHYFKILDEVPECATLHIFADTAMKTGQANDYSVFQLWGKKDNSIFLLEQWRGKWESPELLMKAKEVISYARSLESDICRLQGTYIEDKASGIGLIQQLRKPEHGNHHIIPLKADRDKFTRAMNSIPYMEQSRVFMARKGWNVEYISEFLQFSSNDTHKHDDQIDTTNYAIMELLGKQSYKGVW